MYLFTLLVRPETGARVDWVERLIPARCRRAAALVAVAVAVASPFAPPARAIVDLEGPITGRVFDTSLGPGAGIHFALVELHIPGASGGVTSATTDVDGSFAVTLPPGDDSYVFMSVHADGFYPFNQWSSGPALRHASPLAIGLEPAPERVDTAIAGLVYDASIGPTAPIAGAAIEYVYHSYNDAFPAVAGSQQTDADGRYAFDQLLGVSDYFEFSVAAPGFAPFVGYLSASEVLGGTPRNFGLAPIGGIVQVEPAQIHIDCPGSFTVTVTNVGAADETLVILGVTFDFHYGEGVYGMGFSADLSQVQFPVLLASGEQLRFPMTFTGRGGSNGFPTLLNLGIVSGARAGGGGAQYYGGFHPCAATCAGDCDASGTVTVDELIRGVEIALGDGDLGTCTPLDTDTDAAVSVGELVAAVESALVGCGP